MWSSLGRDCTQHGPWNMETVCVGIFTLFQVQPFPAAYEHAWTHRDTDTYLHTLACMDTHTHTHTRADLNWPVMKDTSPHPISLLWSWHVAFLAEYLRSSTFPEVCGPTIPSSSQQPTRFVLRNQLIKFLLPVEDFDEATGRGAKNGFHLHVRWDCAGYYYPIRCSLVRVLVLP